jgi:type II secretory ATPase GspE/PulE/Tfp pilus assembly ATPase PilB-like protein
MVGEIRDLETARMAVQAALTGHLVFSTLHTNDAPSAPARLVDMGIEPFLVSAALIGVMAQRLVRVICSKCKEPYRPSLAVLERWGLGDRKESLVVYRGRGCQECKGTGFYGRTGIFELMTIDDELREMITSGAPPLVLRRKACEKGMRLLWRDGRKKVLKGITTFEEVARVCEEIELRSEPGLIEAKPYIKPLEKIEAKEVGALKEIKVEAKDLEEYRKKIARWLSGEK